MKTLIPWLAVLSVGMSQSSGVCQDFSYGLEVEGVECGDEIFGKAGETIRLNVTAFVEQSHAGNHIFLLSVAGQGADVVFGFDPCDKECSSDILFPGGNGDEVLHNFQVLPDPDLVPEAGPLAGSRQGAGIGAGVILRVSPLPPQTVPAGRTDLLRFFVDVEVPADEGDKVLNLFFKDGLLTPEIEPVLVNGIDAGNGLVFEEDSLSLNGCSITVKPRSSEFGFKRGDANYDSTVDVTDAITTLNALFLGEETLPCGDSADSNDDGNVDISDAINTLAFLFLGASEIPEPGPATCGPDPTDDFLYCVSFSLCP